MKKYLKKLTSEVVFTKGRGLALLFSVLLVASGFLPWGYTDNVSVAGLEGDGLITISIGVLAFLLLFVKRIALWVSLILGIIAFIVGVIDMTTMYRAVQAISGDVGSGIYLTLVSSAGIVLGVIVENFEEKKKMNLFYVDEE